MERGGWRGHVRAELRRRERSGRGLRALLERQEKLQDRLQALRGTQEEPPGEAPGRNPHQAQLLAEVQELRRQRAELHQQVSLLSDVLLQTQAENQEQRGRVGRLAQEVAALKRSSEELQCQAWMASQEAGGLRLELERVQGLLQETRQARQELEARWVREKALEAERLNRANEQEEKYRLKVIRLREKLEQLREALSLLQPCCKCRLNLQTCHWQMIQQCRCSYSADCGRGSEA